MTDIPGQSLTARAGAFVLNALRGIGDAAKPANQRPRARRVDMPQTGESFASFDNRTGQSGSETLRRYSTARNLPQSAPQGTRARWAEEARRVVRDTGPLPMPGQNYALGTYDLRQDTPSEQRNRQRGNEIALRTQRAQIFQRDPSLLSTLGPPELPAGVRAAVPTSPDPHRAGFTRPDLVQLAAAASGADPTYMRQVIQQESGGNVDIGRSETSSATGVAQFIDDTWLKMMRAHGAEYGLDQSLLDAANPKSSTYNPEASKAILDLRHNGEWSAIMAGYYASENATILENRLGRTPLNGEVSLAHFLGGDTAAAWSAEATNPRTANVNARQFLRRIYANKPEQATAIISKNPSVFTERATVGEVYRNRALATPELRQRWNGASARREPRGPVN